MRVLGQEWAQAKGIDRPPTATLPADLLPKPCRICGAPNGLCTTHVETEEK